MFLFRNKFVHSGSGKNEIFLICAGTDITEERRTQERLRILANTDTVTGLPNRNAIHEFINNAIASAGESQVGIVYLDLDNFKKSMMRMAICLAISSYKPFRWRF